MKLRKVSRETWRKTHSDYKGVITDSCWTGWPVGTKTMLDMDEKTGATVLVPVEVEERGKV